MNLPPVEFGRPPVVLVGGVNLVRALGLAGIPAIVATWDPDEPALRSRHCSDRVMLPRPDGGPAAADALARLGEDLAGRAGRRIPLMYGSDGALELIQAHRERLARHFLFLLPDPDVAAALISKERFAAFARHRGLPAPRSLAWNGDGPGSVIGTATPVLVKPSDKVDWHNSALCRELFAGEGKARVFASGAEAARHPGVAQHHRHLTFQEFIPGGDEDHWSFHGFADEEGHVLASFVGRKIRTFPTTTGESAFIEMAQDESLEAEGRKVASRCPLKGPFKMDFKRDPRDGRWYLLEINARYTLWHYLGAANGVNLPRAAYEYLVDGQRAEPVQAVPRYRWLALGLDFRAYREMAARGEITAPRWAASILGSRNIYDMFSWSDPGPWLAFWGGRIARRLKRACRDIAALSPWRSTAS
jgi:D-aspartate ligase